MNKIDDRKLAAVLVGGVPMAFKAHPDGSLVVIGPSGRKFRFTAEEVEKVKAMLGATSPGKKPTSTHRSRKSPAKAVPKDMKPEPSPKVQTDDQ